MLYRVSLTGKHDRFSVPQLGYLGYHRLTLSWIERLARESKHVIRVRVVHCSPGRAPALPVSSPNQTSVAYADTRGATTLFNWTEVGLKAVFSMRWLCCPRIRIGRHRNQSCGKEDAGGVRETGSEELVIPLHLLKQWPTQVVHGTG